LPPLERSALHQRLHDNQLTIASQHRGGRAPRPDGVEILSGDAALRYVVLEAPLAVPLPEGCHTVRVMPWAGDLSRPLRQLGFYPQGDLLYMSLQGALPMPPEVAGYRLERALSPEAIDAFTDIQLDAFPGLPRSRGPRFDFLRASQLRYLEDPSHYYLLGLLGPQAVSAGLLLCTAGVGGIYSLATRLPFRGQGLSRVLLSRLVHEAHAGGCDVIALQVHAGALAERLYRRLGFQQEFRVTVYERC
jgi:GNAT superfamily N-acetyltransferase